MGAEMGSLTRRAMSARRRPGTRTGLGLSSKRCSCMGSLRLPHDDHEILAVPVRPWRRAPTAWYMNNTRQVRVHRMGGEFENILATDTEYIQSTVRKI